MKTVRIEKLVPADNPDGIHQIKTGTSSLEMFIVPRSEVRNLRSTIADVKPAINSHFVYFLHSRGNSGQDSLYIGETSNILTRLADHNRDENKDFWQNAIIFYTSNQSFDPTLCQHLEQKLTELAQTVNRVKVENRKNHNRNQLDRFRVSELDGYIERIKFLLSSEGYKFLNQPEQNSHVFFAKVAKEGVEAKGVFDGDEFVILPGSVIRGESTPSAPIIIKQTRDELITQGLLEPQGSNYVTTSGYTASSPSLASGLVLGRASNGWEDWRDEDGNKLDLLRRDDSELVKPPSNTR